MINFVIHDKAGRLTQYGSVIESILDLQAKAEKGEFLTVGDGDIDNHWVQDGKIVARPNLGHTLSARTVTADGADPVILAGVPAGATIEILGPISASGESTGEDITLTFALPGHYTILVKHFPHLDVEEAINAV